MNASPVLIDALNRATADTSLRQVARNCGIDHGVISRIMVGRTHSISDENAKKLIPYLIGKGFLDEDDLRESLMPDMPRPKLRDPLPHEVDPLKEWLQAYMEDHQLGLPQLAELTNVAESTYRRWFDAKRPSLPRASIIKRLQKWQRDQSYFQQDNRPHFEVAESSLRYDVDEKQVLRPVHPSEFQAVPIVALAEASGFSPAMGSLKDYLTQFAEDTYEWHGAKEHFFCVQVRGDSLEPDIHDGAKLLVAGGEFPKRGQLVLAKLHDGTLVAKWYHRKDGDVTLASRNPNGKSYTFKIATNPDFILWMFPVVKIEIDPTDLFQT